MYVQEERILRYIYIYKLRKCTFLYYKMTRIFDPKFSPSKAQWLSLIDLVENLHKCSKHLEYLWVYSVLAAGIPAAAALLSAAKMQQLFLNFRAATLPAAVLLAALKSSSILSGYFEA